MRMQFKIPSAYSIYLVLCCGYFLVGGLLLWYFPKGDEILFWDARRTQFGDFFFAFITRYGEAVPFVLAFLFFLARRQYVKAGYIPVLAILVTSTSYLLKTYFAEARPGSFFKAIGKLEQLNLVDGVQLNMGMTSFPSGHTLSAFAVSTFLVLTLSLKPRWHILFFSLAGFVAISRVYLVQHFLVDVYFGAALGIVVGGLVAYLAKRHTTWLEGRKVASA